MEIPKQVLVPSKALVIVIWVACITNFFLPFPGNWETILKYLFYLIVVVHLVETAIFLPRILKSDEARPAALVKSFVYGLFHNYRYLGQQGRTE